MCRLNNDELQQELDRSVAFIEANPTWGADIAADWMCHTARIRLLNEEIAERILIGEIEEIT